MLIPTQCTTYNMTMTFTDDDLLVGSKLHNRLLFVTGTFRGKWLSEF